MNILSQHIHMKYGSDFVVVYSIVKMIEVMCMCIWTHMTLTKHSVDKHIYLHWLQDCERIA